ncbi:MAG: hypothetical protein E6G89_06600 [Alphaproteobacteria bacterium]|nr:MAG: hypothetical protein E6G87_06795 [Alphaproteobacteria bacterium]TMJ41364.1 MAG: hypothetical protein E6G89_06600 [Alphaproteobacteria bacterium]
MTDFAKLRRDMVDRQIISRGVRSPLVVEAMLAVPREIFLPRSLREFAYEDSPLPRKRMLPLWTTCSSNCSVLLWRSVPRRIKSKQPPGSLPALRQYQTPAFW